MSKFARQSADSNWRPRSVVRVEAGEPKRAIQPLTNASATVSAVMFAMVMASGQRVKRSTQVRRYLKHREGNSKVS